MTVSDRIRHHQAAGTVVSVDRQALAVAVVGAELGDTALALPALGQLVPTARLGHLVGGPGARRAHLGEDGVAGRAPRQGGFFRGAEADGVDDFHARVKGAQHVVRAQVHEARARGVALEGVEGGGQGGARVLRVTLVYREGRK